MRETIQIKDNCKLIISKALQSQILYAHSHVGNTEWSGFFWYSIEAGDIKNSKDLVLKANHMHLLDIGNPTYTEFSADERIFEVHKDYPKSEDEKMGIIHTHSTSYGAVN